MVHLKLPFSKKHVKGRLLSAADHHAHIQWAAQRRDARPHGHFVWRLFRLSPTAWKEAVFGGGGVSHIEQTIKHLKHFAKQYFPFVEHLTRSMVNARDAISQANADVDDNQTQSALHCDGENLDEAQSRLQTFHAETIAALNDNNAGGAREALGSALHTVQDFYAHSNWVEMGNTAPSGV